MNNTNTGGAAFPNSHFRNSNGMTLRDYFAAKAMQSYLSAWIVTKQHPETDLVLAGHAYAMADAMLKARAQ
jgi:hypothetical protein